jgi:hypothetical protein
MAIHEEPLYIEALPAQSELRASLPASVAIWVGGHRPCAGLRVSGIRVMSRLVDITEAAARGRQDPRLASD